MNKYAVSWKAELWLWNARETSLGLSLGHLGVTQQSWQYMHIFRKKENSVKFHHYQKWSFVSICSWLEKKAYTQKAKCYFRKSSTIWWKCSSAQKIVYLGFLVWTLTSWNSSSITITRILTTDKSLSFSRLCCKCYYSVLKQENMSPHNVVKLTAHFRQNIMKQSFGFS